jgi:hypothetical protein
LGDELDDAIENPAFGHSCVLEGAIQKFAHQLKYHLRVVPKGVTEAKTDEDWGRSTKIDKDGNPGTDWYS